MMKNIVKLMITITLVTGLGISAFIKPAEARRRRSNTYSETSTDATKIILQFNLVDTTLDGNPIVDFDNNPDNNIGIFQGAIENLSLAKYGRLTQTGGQYDSFGNLQLAQPFSSQETLLAEGDLRAEFIPTDPSFSGYSTIHYSILNHETDEVINITDPENPSGILPLEFILFPEFNPLAQDKKAINSLSYILSKNLLGQSQSGSRYILANAPVQEEDLPPTGVPEPSSTAGLLAWGALGVRAVLKRKLKSS